MFFMEPSWIAGQQIWSEIVTDLAACLGSSCCKVARPRRTSASNDLKRPNRPKCNPGRRSHLCFRGILIYWELSKWLSRKVDLGELNLKRSRACTCSHQHPTLPLELICRLHQIALRECLRSHMLHVRILLETDVSDSAFGRLAPEVWHVWVLLGAARCGVQGRMLPSPARFREAPFNKTLQMLITRTPYWCDNEFSGRRGWLTIKSSEFLGGFLLYNGQVREKRSTCIQLV